MPTNELLEIPADVKDTAQKVWFAGLGALAMAQEESGKLFNMLVERGAEVEKDGLAPVATVKETAKGTAAPVTTTRPRSSGSPRRRWPCRRRSP